MCDIKKNLISALINIFSRVLQSHVQIVCKHFNMRESRVGVLLQNTWKLFIAMFVILVSFLMIFNCIKRTRVMLFITQKPSSYPHSKKNDRQSWGLCFGVWDLYGKGKRLSYGLKFFIHTHSVRKFTSLRLNLFWE